MIYTQQRRRALNKAVKAMYPDIQFYESPDGIPVMECSTLPQSAKLVVMPEDLFQRINRECVRKDSMGMNVPDYGKSLPVFIHSQELNGNNVRNYYRVNYVSPSEKSCEMAAVYIAEGRLYADI